MDSYLPICPASATCPYSVSSSTTNPVSPEQDWSYSASIQFNFAYPIKNIKTKSAGIVSFF